MKNPKVELCAFSEGKWMRVKALAVRDLREDVKYAMLKSQPGVAKMFKGKEEIFCLKNITATLYSFGKETIVMKDEDK